MSATSFFKDVIETFLSEIETSDRIQRRGVELGEFFGQFKRTARGNRMVAFGDTRLKEIG